MFLINPPLDGLKSLMHYGMPRRSGRYPWGSGKEGYQRAMDFIGRLEELKKQGLTEVEIAKHFDISTTNLRTQRGLAIVERRNLLVARAKDLQAKGYSLSTIAEKMGYSNDSSVRNLLSTGNTEKRILSQLTADKLKAKVDKLGMIDVGEGVERYLGVSKEKLKESLLILEREGYPVYGGRIQQVTNPGKHTTMKILCKPGTAHREIYDTGKIRQVMDDDDVISYDNGKTFRKVFEYPASMDSKRLTIRYAEDGGTKQDGVIELRRGIKDLDLGGSLYSQVRILVDGDRYLKGMAVYADDLPDGIDVRFNTNKTKDKSMRDVLKKIHDDPDNPFGSLIKERGGQSYYIDKDGKEKLSLINKRSDSGDWSDWADALPSQFLAKQNKKMIKNQLDLAKNKYQTEFEEIMALTNPTVKRLLLSKFADTCDGASVHLKAAALPRQKYHVILPVNSLKDDEVFAPKYNHGETVALIRYPHAGTFEIPILRVNNRNKEALNRIGSKSPDAVGIRHTVAERLSGADFDGDTVMVIPCNSPSSKVKITSTPPLKGLEGFDNKLSYGTVEGVDKKGNKVYLRNGKPIKVMANTDKEMGVISNLIMDMTIKGAKDDELAKAVKHSMVVIDAEKHKLDWKASEIDNDIRFLKKKYQTHIDPITGEQKHGGTSTLLTMAKSPHNTLKRVGSPKIDKETGEVSYKEVVEKYVDKHGKEQVRTISIPKMDAVKDARKLSSGYEQEELYADYANSMKAMANKARKELMATSRLKYSPEAKVEYRHEVNTLLSHLNTSIKNKPLEREAQFQANSIIKAKISDNPSLKDDKKAMKKLRHQTLAETRAKQNAHRHKFDITDKQWEAIQKGAITDETLMNLLKVADIDKVRELAMPRRKNELSTSQVRRLKLLASNEHTLSEIANDLGISVSTVEKYLHK